MSDDATAAVEAPEGQMTKESLFPTGQPESLERARWFRDQNRQEAAETPESEAGEVEEEENLAEAQETEQEIEAETVQEAALGRMRLKEFLDAAGVSMEEFYRDVMVERDGTEVSVSQAWDDYKQLKDANETLLRERSELVEKVNQSATRVMQPGVSPEAQALANQAQMKMQQIAETDWSQVDPGMAANMKFDLQAQAQQLWQQAQAKQAEHQTAMQGEMRKALDEADRLTRAAIPEWNDQAVRNTEFKAIKDMVSAYGIQPQEVDEVIDPRWRRFLRDQLQTNAKQARIQQGARKIRKVSKTLSPGARAPIAKAPTLDGARAQLQKAREGGATKPELDALRLQVQLPDVPKPKRRR